MKLLSLIFFIIISSTIYLSMHFYLVVRLKVDFHLVKNQTILVSIIIFILSFSFLISEVAKRSSGNKFFVYLGEIWIGLVSIAISFLIIKDLISLFIGPNRYLIISTYILIILITSYSLWNGLRLPIVKEINIKVQKKSNNALNNFTIVQLTDMHMDFSVSEKRLERIIDKVNNLNADTILITGDLIDADLAKNEKIVEIFRKLKSKYGVFAITGNHEYYIGIDKFIILCRKSGIRYLNNENILLDNKIYIAGVNDITGRRFPGYSPDFNKTFENIDFTKPVVLMNHQPLHFEEVSDKGVDLQLSGHIHNGQIPPILPTVYLMFKYTFGLYKYKNSFIYTSCGTGTWGPPMRIFSENEIVKFVLN